MGWLSAGAIGAVIAGLALAVRLVVHAGRTPGGVDTWYYLAYARAVRLRPSLDVRLPQYLLQDEVQSYPPVFPSALALLPERWLDRGYWLLSPVVDCVQLLLLHVVTFRLTGSVTVAAIAASTYAFTPHLISETRSLSARPFGALLHVLAILLLLKWNLSNGPVWAGAAAFAGALLFLSSAAMAAAYGFVCVALSVVFADARYGLIACAALGLAFALSGGRMARVIRNYVSAVEYWRRNHRLYGAHPIRHSPLHGDPAARPAAQRPIFRGQSTLPQILRLIGENPFLVALPLAIPGTTPWEHRLYVWAIALVVLAVIATVVPPLRAFGPGRSYLKAAIFPTAFTLAYQVGSPSGLRRPFGLLVLACLGLSVAAIAFFCLYVRGQATELTSSVPAGLMEATRVLADLPAGAVFVLPYMYADYVCYRSGKPVVWGGHCGNLARFEWITPVISRPLPMLFADLRVRYLLLDDRYARPEDLDLRGHVRAIGHHDGFEVFEYQGFLPAGAERTLR
jgi:hypothetical protein